MPDRIVRAQSKYFQAAIRIHADCRIACKLTAQTCPGRPLCAARRGLGNVLEAIILPSHECFQTAIRILCNGYSACEIPTGVGPLRGGALHSQNDDEIQKTAS